MNNPREHIGHNLPPSAIELAEPTIEALNQFLKDFPVIANEDEAREAKPHLDRMAAVLKAIDDERKSKVGPLNEQVKGINATYHKWHNASSRDGLWDKLQITLRGRLTAYAVKEEQKRREAAEAAQRAKEEAERLAREAEERERQAQADADAGVCDVDLGGAMADADTAFADYRRAGRISQRALRNTKVRIGGGFGRVSSLRNHEILTVDNWQIAVAAIEEVSDGLPATITDAILTCARAYRKITGELPPGIRVETERSL